MKKLATVSTLLLVLMVSSSAFSAGVALTGIGARATVLGGNFRGIADDWSAMYWNPAGLTQIKGLSFGTSFEVIMPTASFKHAPWSYIAPPPSPLMKPDTVTTNFSNMKANITNNEPITFYIPALGFTYGMDKLSIGFAVYAPFGLGAKWDLLNTDLYNKNYPQIDYEDDLKILDFHPTVAYKLSDKFSIGAGLSLVYADIIIRKPNYIPNPYLIRLLYYYC